MPVQLLQVVEGAGIRGVEGLARIVHISKRGAVGVKLARIQQLVQVLAAVPKARQPFAGEVSQGVGSGCGCGSGRHGLLLCIVGSNIGSRRGRGRNKW